ncbi:hypothetical protein RVR_62 [Actinacidiphila reveromycinica]|uniref:Uncharacterized protein n=1 Tax=Actinacidiphila reveromycinica TaxID=659352 RepID=A0A7U3UMH9_9ACTN|nr:aldo/keto reductase [Streptomyces sp. SN-593]BBA95268.1 hypothetical protein RVR_62 [Streptomyces sp. SN-593]
MASSDRRAAGTRLPFAPPPPGLGTARPGELFEEVTEQDAAATLRAAEAVGDRLADPSDDAMFPHRPVPADTLARARRCQEVCARFGVPLPAAAVRFPSLHPAVTSVVVGCRSAAGVAANAEAARLPIPDELWHRLADEGYVPRRLLAG